MSHTQLISSNMKNDLVSVIQGIDFGAFSNDELGVLKSWAMQIKERADSLTLEGELVGYTYHNLEALNSRLSVEEARKGISLVKMMKINNHSSRK